MSDKVYIQTLGCQMNERDSENMLALLLRRGFEQTFSPEEADLILLNTCSIREHAGHKASSALGRFGKLNAETGRKAVIGVAGCLAQQEGEKFLQRFPYVDLVLGPDALPRLPDLVAEVREKKRRAIDLERDLDAPVFLHEHLPYPFDEAGGRDLGHKVSAYINISKGCDFRCTFCVVPNTRGPERSAPADEILAEAKTLVDAGVRQLVLLGQNVNSYGKHFTPGSSFAELLSRLETEIPFASPLARIRFTTSHPIDLSRELMECFAKLPRLCPFLHLPVQSGDDAVLRRMKRLYTVADYRKRLADLREILPEISLSTDIIVGFPGETEEQFLRTLDLLREVRYTAIYAFKYSRRPFTPAERLEDDVPEDEKSARLAKVLRLQQEISRAQNKPLESRVMEVLVERRNVEGNEKGFTGRTRCNRLVHFESARTEDLRGRLVQVRIDSAQPHSLLGTALEAEKGIPDTWIKTKNLSR